MTKKVPTNIITGFLGVGKTTAILNLLKTNLRMKTGLFWLMSSGKSASMAH